jgi:hypothetical protein
LNLCDDTQRYRIDIQKGVIDNVSITTEQDIGSNDLVITASFKVWAGFFKEIPEPIYADMNELVTEKREEMSGNVLLY